MKSIYLLLIALFVFGCAQNNKIELAQNSVLEISVTNTEKIFWQYTVLKTGKTMPVTAPVFEIDGKPCLGLLSQVTTGDPQPLGNSVISYSFSGPLRSLRTWFTSTRQVS